MLVLAVLGLLLWLVYMGTPFAGKGAGKKEVTDWSFLKSTRFWLLTGLLFCQNAAEQSVTGYDQARSSDPERFRLWYNGLLQRGIYAAPSQFEAMFLSSAHTDEDIQRVIDAAREIF